MKQIQVANDVSKDRPTTNRKLFALAVSVVAFAVPYVARFVALPYRDPDWLASYMGSVDMALGGAAWNIGYAVLVYGLLMTTRYINAAAWWAVIASLSYLFIVHFAYFDVTAGSTAGLGIVSVPICAAMVAIIAWFTIGEISARWFPKR